MDNQENDRLELLENRVRDLETEVRSLRNATTNLVAPLPPQRSAATANFPPPPQPGGASHPAPRQTAPTPPRPGRTVERLELDSEVVLKWGGIGLVVLAVAFALSTAIQRGWIGPELQLLGALVLGSGLIGLGIRLKPTRPGWTHALCTGGVLTFYTIFASYLFEDLVGNSPGLVLTVLVAVGGYALARVIGSEWVGVATALGGIVAGLVLEVRDASLSLAILWGSIILLPAIVLALDRGWHGLRFTSFFVLAFWFFGIANEVDGGLPSLVLLAGLGVVGAAVLVIPSIGNLSSVWQQLEVQGAGALAPWLLFCIGFGLDVQGEPDWRYLALATTAAVGSLAVLLRPRIKSAHFVSLLIGSSVTLSVAIGAFISTEYTFLGLAVQGAGLLLLRRHLGDSIRILVNALVLLAISSGWVAALMLEAWSDNVSIGDDALHLGTIAALAVAVYLLRERDLRYIGAFGVLALLLTWLGSVLVHLPQGQAAVSLSWAAIGTALLLGGAYFRRPIVGATGLGVLGLTVAKLLTVDLAAVDALWRAGLFLIVGLGLLRLGFSLPKLMGANPPDEAMQDHDQLAEEPR